MYVPIRLGACVYGARWIGNPIRYKELTKYATQERWRAT